MCPITDLRELNSSSLCQSPNITCELHLSGDLSSCLGSFIELWNIGTRMELAHHRVTTLPVDELEPSIHNGWIVHPLHCDTAL